MMALSFKNKSALAVAFGIAIGYVLDAAMAIPLLNLETWAKENEYDTLYKLLSFPQWLVAAWNFVLGPFGWGFALGALVFGFWEHRNVLSKRKREEEESKREEDEYEKNKAALPKLRTRGVELRNELLAPMDDFDWPKQRKRLVRWSNSVVKRLKALNYPLQAISSFETFGTYKPRGIVGKTVTDEAQLKLTTMYNEKIARLEEIMDIPPVPPL